MKVPDFILRFVGKHVAKKLELSEGPMDTKKWYQSKTMWSDVVTVAIAIVGLVDAHFAGGKIATNPGYGVALTILGAMGLYGRKNATTQIK